MRLPRCRDVIVFIVAWACAWGGYVEEFPDHYVNDFVVKIDGDDLVADLVARTHGFRVAERIEGLGGNMYSFVHDEVEHRSRRSAESYVDKLSTDPNVLFAEQQRLLVREKRGPVEHSRNMVYDKQTELERPDVDQEAILERYFGSAAKRQQNPCAGTKYARGWKEFDDPYYCLQWYLLNNGETKGKRGYDINVQEAWKRFTGKGVVVSVLDDGLDHGHPEIAQNYDERASFDFNDPDDPNHDPQPPTTSSATAHGTRCAGEIAGAANNGVCGVGVAYNARIGGVRILDGAVVDKLEARAIEFERDYIDIYSASWGPRDDGKTMEGPNSLTEKALKDGTELGRGGKGSIFAWATGNGGFDDDCNADNYVGSIYTIAIGCINDQGLSTYFSERCPSTMACIFTGGSNQPPGSPKYDKPDISIITADVGSVNGEANCNVDFEGTSSAAPLAAGCFALVLEANPELTWRDMQHLIVETAKIPNPEEGGWSYNGAGYHVNHRFGFGAINCGGMVAMALMWTQVSEQVTCVVPTELPKMAVSGGDRNSQSFELTIEDCDIDRLEHVKVRVKFYTTYRGDMSLHLVSASGTDSEILSPRPRDSYSGTMEWTFMTTHKWNERPTGNWTLWLQDQGPPHRAARNEFEILEWELELYGTRGPNPNEDLVRANKTTRVVEKEPDRACEIPPDSLNEVMNQELAESDQLNEAISGKSTFVRAGKLTPDVDAEVRRLVESFDDSDVTLLEKIINDALQEEASEADDQNKIEDEKSIMSQKATNNIEKEEAKVSDEKVRVYQKYLTAKDEEEELRRAEERKTEREMDKTLDLIYEILANMDK